jgi:osmotically-inducible protein OsmY
MDDKTLRIFVSKSIEDAIQRNAYLEAREVGVEVHYGKVTLEGRVPSWIDRRTVEKAAWAVPGVCQVEDHLRSE